MFLFEGAETPIHASMLDVSGKGLDFQDKMKNRRDMPTPEEIDRYVGLLIARIKNERLKKDKIALIRKALESSSAQDTLDIEELEDQPTAVVYEGENENISTAGLSYTDVKRVHQMVSERLYTRLATDKDLSSLGLKNLFVREESKYEDSPHLSRISNLNTGEAHILRKDRMSEVGELTKNEENAKTHAEALRRYISLPENEYLLPYAKYSPEDRKGLVKKIDSLKTLNTLIGSYDSKLADLLVVIRDGMKGAKLLDDNGLVLQDISVANLGQIKNKNGSKKGLLFDMEGVYIKGAMRNNRLFNTDVFYLSDGSEGDYKYFPPELESNMNTPVLPSEMVYQFGRCLEEVMESNAFKIFKASTSPELVSKLYNLADSMLYFDDHQDDPIEKRPTISDALDSLEKIMGEIEQSQLN